MRISRSTGALSGLILVVLGVWGAVIPFVGPYFHYAFGTNTTWHYTTERLWLDILPGAAVVLGGLVLLQAGHRVSGTLGSWLAMAGGAWFAVGPAFARLWEHGAGPIGGPLFGHTRQWLELIGYFYGLGVVVVALAAFALGRVVTRPGIVTQPVTYVPPEGEQIRATRLGTEPVAAEPVAAQPAAAEPVAATPATVDPADSTAPRSDVTYRTS